MELLKKALVAVLTLEARLILAKYKPLVIAVTGNVGKTSTKDAIYTVLEETFRVRKSEKSLNSEFGVPLTIIGMESGWHNPLRWLLVVVEGLRILLWPVRYPRVLVLEVGADHPGDIKRIATWLKPTIAVITGIPAVPAHVEFFSSPEALAAEKKELAYALRPGGTVIINGDDALSRAMYDDFRASAIRYGVGTGNEFSASHAEVVYQDAAPIGVRFRINHAGSSVPVLIEGVLGRTHVLPSLAACAVASVLDINLVTAGSALLKHVAGPGRMRVLPGKKGSTLIDDTYNASPSAVHAALDALHEIDAAGKKVAVLGDMLELGVYSDEAHDQVGAQACGIVSELVTMGEGGARIAEAARLGGLNPDRIHEYGKGEIEEVSTFLVGRLREGDVVLVKGSQGMRMEKVSAALLLDPASAASSLVRQDKEWLATEVSNIT